MFKASQKTGGKKPCFRLRIGDKNDAKPLQAPLWTEPVPMTSMFAPFGECRSSIWKRYEYITINHHQSLVTIRCYPESQSLSAHFANKKISPHSGPSRLRPRWSLCFLQVRTSDLKNWQPLADFDDSNIPNAFTAGFIRGLFASRHWPKQNLFLPAG